MTKTMRDQNFKKHPHTARFLMTFHAAGGDLPTEIDAEGNVIDDGTEEISADVWAAASKKAIAAPAAPVDRRSEKQTSYMDSLVAQLTALDAERGQEFATFIEQGTRTGYWTPGMSGTASKCISALKDAITDARSKAAAERKAASADTEEGFYVKDDTVYKVQIAVHGSGRPYAKRLVVAEYDGVKSALWEYAAGAVRELKPEHKLTLEQAKEFGKLYGVCVRCGTVLTDEFSIENGIGPVCITKF